MLHLKNTTIVPLSTQVVKFTLGNAMSVQQIFIVRHGETDYNLNGRWQGHLDIPLNKMGRDQAQLVGEALRNRNIGAIYSSDLTRAYDTAQAISAATGISIEKDVRLREIHCGIFQGLTRSEILQTYPLEQNHWDNSDGYPVPQGESRLQVQARVFAFFEEVTTTSNVENVVFVSHGGTIRWLLNKLCPPEIVAGYHFYNTSVTTLQRVVAKWVLVRAGDTSHLDKSTISSGKRY